MDLIRAKSDRAHTAAIHELEGHLSAKIDQARDRLLTILAHVEAHIDFPEEDLGPEVRKDLLKDTQQILGFLQSLLATAHEGKILRDGVSVAIVGRPNVGKSSLLNALVGRDRSIVTPIPGTTRDTIEESASINGVPFRFTDTAGIRRTRGAAEALGVNRSHKALADSEIVLHVCDTSKPLTTGDSEIMKAYCGRTAILVLNKADLPHRLNLSQEIAVCDHVFVSALRGDGLEALKAKLLNLAYSGAVGSTDVDVAINARHAASLEMADKTLTAACQSVRDAEPLEIVSQRLRMSLDCIGEIVGKTCTEDLLNRIFSTFCIGK
jgi:tRNA modification GTPase